MVPGKCTLKFKYPPPPPAPEVTGKHGMISKVEISK